MYQYVIFDLDGTLLNTLDDLADAGNWVCRNHGWPEHSQDAYKYFVGNGMAKLVERFSPEMFRGQEQIVKTLEEFMFRYEAHKADKTAVYAGIPEILDKLQKAGVHIAVLTNKADGVAGGVVEEYYPGVFKIVQGAVPEKPTKPDPIIDAAVSTRPKAAVALGAVLWICAPRRTSSVERMATTFTKPSILMPRTK